jgi:hypothetical protein
MIVSALILGLMGASTSPATTPQEAALRVFQAGRKRVNVVRINRAGRYATVLTHGGEIESATYDGPILVEHFSFGWQALDLLSEGCTLKARRLDPEREALLMAGMPAPQDDGHCTPFIGDVGAPAQVAAVRMMMGPLVPSVVISGPYALGAWYGGGGGETLFRSFGGHWRRVGGGGGAMGVAEMRAAGVPRSAWCPFHIYDASCPQGS